MPLASHLVCCDRPSNIRRNVHIMKLLCWTVWRRTEECLVSVQRIQSILMHCSANCFGEVKNNKNNLRQVNPSQSLDLNLRPSDTKQQSSLTLFHQVQLLQSCYSKRRKHFTVKNEDLFILYNNFGLLIFLHSFPLRF
jgi:hypothetical protein